MWEVTHVCVWYVWECVCRCVFECIWACTCVCMPVEARGWCGEVFSITLPPYSSRQGFSQTQSSLTLASLVSQLALGILCLCFPKHKLSCLSGMHMTSGLSTSIFPVVWRALSQVTSPQFLRQGLSLNLKRIFLVRRADHWPPGLRSQASVAVLGFYTGIWGSKLRSSCLQSRPSHPPSHLPSSEIFLTKEKSLC